MDRDHPDESEKKEHPPFSVDGYMAENDETRREFSRSYDAAARVPEPPSYESIVSQGAAAFPTPGSGVVEEHIRQGDQSSNLRLFIPLVPGGNNSVEPILGYPLDLPPSYDELDRDRVQGDNTNTAFIEVTCNIEDEIHNTGDISAVSATNQSTCAQNQPGKKVKKKTVRPTPKNNPPNRQRTTQQQQTQQQPARQRPKPTPPEKPCWLHQQILDLKIPSVKFVIIVTVLLALSLTEIVVGIMSYDNCTNRIPSLMIVFAITLPVWILFVIHCVKFKKQQNADSKLVGLVYLLSVANIGITIAGTTFVYSTLDTRTDPTSEFYCTDLPYFLALSIYTPLCTAGGLFTLYVVLVLSIGPGLKTCFAECKSELKTYPKPRKPATEGLWLFRSIINLEVPSRKFFVITALGLVIPLAIIVVGATHISNCLNEISVGMIVFGALLPISIFVFSYGIRFRQNHGRPCHCDCLAVIFVMGMMACFIYMSVTVFRTFEAHFDRTSDSYCADFPYFLMFSFITPIVAAVGLFILYIIFCSFVLPVLQECTKRAPNGNST